MEGGDEGRQLLTPPAPHFVQLLRFHKPSLSSIRLYGKLVVDSSTSTQPDNLLESNHSSSATLRRISPPSQSAQAFDARQPWKRISVTLYSSLICVLEFASRLCTEYSSLIRNRNNKWFLEGNREVKITDRHLRLPSTFTTSTRRLNIHRSL
jgi:hypothetical protein